MAAGNLHKKGEAYAHFYMGTEKDEEASVKEGRPIFKDKPFVKIFVPGDKDVVIDQPVWDDRNHENSHTSRFPAEWERFQAGLSAEAQEGGTPLAMMPGITKGQVQEMAHFHVRTIEQLAGMSDGNTLKYAGVLRLREDARAYIDRAKGAAPEKQLRAELAQRDEKIATLEKQMALVLAGKPAPEVPTSAPTKPARKSTRA